MIEWAHIGSWHLIERDPEHLAGKDLSVDWTVCGRKLAGDVVRGPVGGEPRCAICTRLDPVRHADAPQRDVRLSIPDREPEGSPGR